NGFSSVAAASAAARRSLLRSAAAAATRGRAPITPDSWTVHIGGDSPPPPRFIPRGTPPPPPPPPPPAPAPPPPPPTPPPPAPRRGDNRGGPACAGTSCRPGPGTTTGSAACPGSVPGQPRPRLPGEPARRPHLSSSLPHLPSRFACPGQNTAPPAQWLAGVMLPIAVREFVTMLCTTRLRLSTLIALFCLSCLRRPRQSARAVSSWVWERGGSHDEAARHPHRTILGGREAWGPPALACPLPASGRCYPPDRRRGCPFRGGCGDRRHPCHVCGCKRCGRDRHCAVHGDGPGAGRVGAGAVRGRGRRRGGGYVAFAPAPAAGRPGGRRRGGGRRARRDRLPGGRGASPGSRGRCRLVVVADRRVAGRPRAGCRGGGV